VISITASELGRDRGGRHCMTCPVLHKAVDYWAMVSCHK
jgi:arginine deiminase